MNSRPRKNLVSLACGLLLSWVFAGAAAEQIEIELASPVFPAVAHGWDRYRWLCCSDDMPSEGELVDYIQDWLSHTNGHCPRATMTAQGEWFDNDYISGIASSQEKSLTFSAYTYHRYPDPTCRPYTSDVTIYRYQRVDCDIDDDGENEPGYRPRSAGCINESSETIRANPQYCTASGGSGDAMRGNPCDASTGDKSMTENDVDLPGLRFSRSYHSYIQFDDTASGFGHGWSHSYDARIIIYNGVPTGLLRANGYVEALRESADPEHPGVFLAQSGSGRQLRAAAGVGWVVYSPSGEREHYDAAGRLLALENALSQLTIVVRNSSGRVLTVTGPFGRVLSFGYDDLGRLARIGDPDGHVTSYAYDDTGNLESVSYPDGAVRRYHYEDGSYPHHLTGITDENGDRYATYRYDARGRVELSEHAGGIGRITLSYNDDGTTTVTDADGYEEILSFTGHEDPWRVTYRGEVYESAGEALQAARNDDPENWNLQPMQPRRLFAGTGDPYRKLTGTETEGSVVSFEYGTGSLRRPLRTTDGNGVITRFGYDGFHRTMRCEAYDETTAACARLTQYRDFLEDASELPRVVETPSVAGGAHRRKTGTVYHGGTRVPAAVTITGFDPGGARLAPRVTTYTDLDSFGHAKRIDGPRTDLSDTTLLGYWETDEGGQPCGAASGGRCGQLHSVTNALGQRTTFDAYTPGGRLLRSVDPNGIATEYTYTARGQVDTITKSAGGQVRVTDYDYDPAGQIARITFPGGAGLAYSYNAAHLLIRVHDDAGNSIAYSYDARGNRSAALTRDPAGTLRRSLAMSYDARNRLQAMHQGSWAGTHYDFDAGGRLVEETDPAGNITRYGYDNLNRPTSIIDALNGPGSPTVRTWDVNDNPLAVVSPNGAVTTYQHDDHGNVLREDSPDRGRTLYAYDAAGNMTCRAAAMAGTVSFDSCEAVPGRSTYSYDALNRLTAIDDLSTSTSPDLTLTWGTSGSGPFSIGRLVRTVRRYGDFRLVADVFSYDAFGNVTTHIQQITAGYSSTRISVSNFRYDDVGRVLSVQYSSGRRVDYERDASGFVLRVTTALDGQTRVLADGIGFAPFGPLVALDHGNGLRELRIHDTAYRLATANVLRPDSGTPIQADTFVYDNAANLIERYDIDPDLDRFFAYDALGRVVFDSTLDSSRATSSYVYDGAGNRLARRPEGPGAVLYPPQARVYEGGSNRPGPATSPPVVYDAAGNRLWEGATGVAAVYDRENRMISLAHNGYDLQFMRDARDHPVRAWSEYGSPGRSEYFEFMPHGRPMAMESQVAGGEITRTIWVWLGDVPLAQIEDQYLADGVTLTDTRITHLHVDHLLTPRLGTDEDAAVVWRWDSDAFGSVAGLSGTRDMRLRFPGQIDYELGGVFHNGRRDYDSNTGRYLQSDPIGLQGGLNTYAYAYGNPLRYYDPYGLWCLPADVRRFVIAAASAGAGGATTGALGGGLIGAGIGGAFGAVAGVLGEAFGGGIVAGTLSGGGAAAAEAAAIGGGRTAIIGAAIGGGLGGSGVGSVVSSGLGGLAGGALEHRAGAGSRLFNAGISAQRGIIGGAVTVGAAALLEQVIDTCEEDDANCGR